MIPLLPQHRDLIEASAISEDVAEARGYRSVEKKTELRVLGFGETQLRVPALLIPIRNVVGDVASYLLRPDEPRIKGGRALKYEIPGGSQMVLDVPRGAHSDIDDPQVPLFITEGSRKADAAVSIGLCCVSLIGVWCWRGTNEKGGKVALADFESVALNGRNVYIVFDSDVMTKASVHSALGRLSEFLRSREARVHFIYLPPGEKGEKVGLDDFIADGGGRSELASLASDELRSLDNDEDWSGPYVETEDGILWRKGAGGGGESIELTNFCARISADIFEDDGLEVRRVLEIESSFNGRSSTFQIPASSFESLDWVIEKIGAGAAVAPGYTPRQRARHAIQTLSGDPPKRERFAHLGWRKIDGRSVYLSSGEAISAEGALEGVDVAVTGDLQGFVLPEPPEGEELRKAVLASLQIAELASDEISIPLLGAIYRAPLGPSDFSFFLVGPTGVFKTATAAVCQSHWGAGLDERNVPGAFRSTVNALEGLLFQAKDCLVLVDEFAPGGTRSDIERAHRDADRVLRSQGNRTGRGRMTRDARLVSARPPQGLALVTGEDLPAGQSLRARIFASELAHGSINVKQLSWLQEAARNGVLAQAMAGFIRYTAPRRDIGGINLLAERDRIRAELSTQAGHRRSSTAAADLLVGIEHFVEFAVDCKALSHEEGQTFLVRSTRAITVATERQSRHQGSAEPTERFRTLLSSALASGHAHLANPQGGEPEAPLGLGWRLIGDGWQPQGKRIGWESAGEIYLDLTAALATAQDIARGAAPIAVGEDTLRKRLHERGHLASTELEKRDTYAVRRVLEGKRREVLRLSPGFLEATGSDEVDGVEKSARSDEMEDPTTQPTTQNLLFEPTETPDGRVGRVPTEEVAYPAATTGSAIDDRTGGSSQDNKPPSPEPDHSDHSDLSPAEQDAIEDEIARLIEKFPDLGEGVP